jgi:glycosyltransferase involved in cell wall biosynthesis
MPKNSTDAAAARPHRRILIVSDSVGAPYHRRGIFHYTTRLIQALHRCGHHVTLLVEVPPAGRASLRAMKNLALVARPASQSARLGEIYHHLCRAAPKGGRVPHFLRQYLNGFLHGAGEGKVVKNDLGLVDYLPPDLGHLRPVDAFLVTPSLYSAATARAMLGLPAPVVDAREFDTVIVDTPTHLAIERKAGTEIAAVIHDLIMLSEASVNERWRRIFIGKLLATLSSATSHIFVSQSTRTAFCRLFPDFARKPDCLLYPSLPELLPEANFNRASSKGNRFAAIITDEPRKNLDNLVAAFALLGDAYHLDVLGQAERRRVAAGREPPVAYLGYVSAPEKARLLASSTGIIVPSHAEGFGIPLIEGAGMGKPVFCSDIPVFREIAGEGAFYFDPRSADSIAEAVRRFCSAPARHSEQIDQLTRHIRARFGFNTFVDSVAQRFGTA